MFAIIIYCLVNKFKYLINFMKPKVVSKKVQEKQATKVRQNFQEVIDQVHYTKESLLITKHNKPWVMIQALEADDKE